MASNRTIPSPFGACPTCGGWAWHLSPKGALVCSACCPPGSLKEILALSIWDERNPLRRQGQEKPQAASAEWD